MKIWTKSNDSLLLLSSPYFMYEMKQNESQIFLTVFTYLIIYFKRWFLERINYVE